MKQALLGALLLFSSILASANSYEPPNRTFSLSSAYFERVFNSNEGLVDFPLSVVDGYGALFDVTTRSINHHWWSRLLIAIAELPFSYWLGNSLFVPFHEFGHARADRAFGVNYHYTTTGYGKKATGISNYWVLSLARLLTPPFFFPGSGPASTGSYEDIEPNGPLAAYWGQDGRSIIFSASGLNNQSLLAKRIAHGLQGNRGHITQTTHYLGNKIAGFGYSLLDRGQNSLVNNGSSDVGKIIEAYRHNGYGITHSHLEFQSLLSLLSGSTYAFFTGYFDYVAHGDARVYPAELFGIRIPDINSYINARGLSFEFVSGYRWSKDLYFDLAYEFIWKGDSAHQVTPTTHFDLAVLLPNVNSLWINSELTLGRGVGANFGAEWTPFEQSHPTFWQRLSYFADFYLYNGLNLYGERNITSISNTSTLAFSGFGGLRINY